MKKSKCCHESIKNVSYSDSNYNRKRNEEKNLETKTYTVCRRCGMICESYEIPEIKEEGETIIELE